MRIKLLKDFPGYPAGTILTKAADGNYKNGNFWLSQSYLDQHPDDFEYIS